MSRILAVLALLAAPMPTLASAQSEPGTPAPEQVEVQPDINHRLLLRCAATFALVANRQELGEEWALAFPPMAERGRLFFVHASAQVMDESGMGRAALEAMLRAEARQLVAYDQARHMMPVCLPLLDEAGI